ncbi:hypothetical protein, partial [uncultured Halovibrio sp.]|uniref:hypothetical protein n=1 Tax=uncultured Halovibrio sp. TaxID=985049 RepID=UPI0025E23035
MGKASPKRKRSEYRELVRDWIEKAKINPDLLYLVKFTDRYSKSPIISAGKFLKSLGLPENGKNILYEECSSDLAEIYDLMHSEGVFISNLTANQLNQVSRLKLLLRWLEEDPELLNLVSVFGNRIQLRRLCNAFPELEISSNIKSGGKARSRPNDYLEKFYKDTFEVRVLELLNEAGLHDPYSYTPVSQRVNSSGQSENASSEIDSFIQASKSVGTLYEAQQISKQPFDSVYYLLAIGSRGRASRSGKENFLSTYKTVVEFCKYKGFNGLEPAYELFSEYFAVRLRVYL